MVLVWYHQRGVRWLPAAFMFCSDSLWQTWNHWHVYILISPEIGRSGRTAAAGPRSPDSRATGRRWGKVCVSNFSGGGEIRWEGEKVTFSSFYPRRLSPCSHRFPGRQAGRMRRGDDSNPPAARLKSCRQPIGWMGWMDGMDGWMGGREQRDCCGLQGNVCFIRQSLRQQSKFNRRHFVLHPFFSLCF